MRLRSGVLPPLTSPGRGQNGGATEFVDIFGAMALNSRELKKLNPLAEPVRLTSGKPIFVEGEIANEVYGLSRGIVRVYKNFPDGSRHILRFALPGEFLELPDARYHSVFAAAIGEVAASRFSRSELLAFAQTSRNMTRLMLKSAADKLHYSYDQMVILRKVSAEEKIVAFLGTWCKRFGGSVAGHVPLPMSRRDIAAHLGIAHETLSRAFRDLVSVRRVLESYESSVIQDWWPDSRRGHRCGRARTAPATTAASCDIRAI
jgi:CRP/FNR family transcriptional regulator